LVLARNLRDLKGAREYKNRDIANMKAVTVKTYIGIATVVIATIAGLALFFSFRKSASTSQIPFDITPTENHTHTPLSSMSGYKTVGYFTNWVGEPHTLGPASAGY
jgi:hypothetical protein